MKFGIQTEFFYLTETRTKSLAESSLYKVRNIEYYYQLLQATKTLVLRYRFDRNSQHLFEMFSNKIRSKQKGSYFRPLGDLNCLGLAYLGAHSYFV